MGFLSIFWGIFFNLKLTKAIKKKNVNCNFSFGQFQSFLIVSQVCNCDITGFDLNLNGPGVEKKQLRFV